MRPHFFTEAQTPWGSAIDYRVPEVRAFAIENALHWLRDYRFDGLRLDAVHAIAEPGEVSMLHDLSRPSASSPRRPAGTSIWCWRTTTIARACSMPGEDPPRGKYRAQWNDDYHHAWHVLLTGETHGYYSDYQTIAARRTSRARSAPASSIRARPPRIAAGDCAASRAAQLVADRLRQFPAEPRPDRQPRARRPARKHGRSRGDRGRAGDHAAGADDADAVHGRGMGLEGALPVLLRFPGRARRRRAQGPAQGIRRGLCTNMATRFPIRWTHRPCNPRCWIGMRANGAAGTPAAGAGARAARDPPARNRAAACGRSFWRGAGGGQRLADGALAHGRRRNAVARSPTCRIARSPRRPSQPTGTPIWGGDVERDACRLVGVLAHRIAMMPPAIPIATYRLQLTADFDFDAAAARRALSEGARHHAISMPRPS